jgi:hypothetical protein
LLPGQPLPQVQRLPPALPQLELARQQLVLRQAQQWGQQRGRYHRTPPG